MVNIGIDLGTTNSAVGVFKKESVEILRNSEGMETTPSVIFFTNDNGIDDTLVGYQAKNAAMTAPNNVVQFVKRQMGKSDYKYISPSQNEYNAESLSAIILKKLKQDAELSLGESVKNAVITVPAYFDDAQRVATKQAGLISGINVLRVINEPTAAALAFGIQDEKNGKVLVYDLGGGTFDVTLMEVNDKKFDVIATGGDSKLGGINFDQILSGLIYTGLESEGLEIDIEDDLLNSEIREKAEIAKKQLSNIEQTKPRFTIEGKTYTVKITRDQFEQASKTLLDRTELYIDEIFEEQNITWNDIDHLLVIGGSTRMPMVKKLLEKLSGKTVKYEVNPDTAVAIGAAILASTLDQEKKVSPGIGSSKLQISDVTSQTLGLITFDPTSDEKQNSPIILNNTKIPAKSSIQVSTRHDNQTTINITVTEGKDIDLEFVKIVGEKDLTIPSYPKGAPIEVTYAYDIDQTIFIEVKDLTTNKSLGTFDIDRSANLNAEELGKSIEIVQQAEVE